MDTRTLSFGRSVRSCAAVMTVSVLLAACASTPPAPEVRVAQRAQARWDAMIKGDFRAAYAFLSPASRAMTHYDLWAATRKPTATEWKGASVVKVECRDAQVCKARVNINHQPLVGGGSLGTISSAVDETWLIDDGEWWLLYTR